MGEIKHDVLTMRRAVPTRPSLSKPGGKQAETLLARFMHAEKDGSLAQCIRAVVATNRRQATKANPAV